VVKASFTLPNGTSIVVEGKVSLDLPSGTVVTLEGTPKDMQRVLDNFNGFNSKVTPKSKTNGSAKSLEKQDEASDSSQTTPDILKIVNMAKSCPEAEAIEKNILENQPSETDRVLLPLYIVHEYLDNAYGLTTVEIAAIAKELGTRAKITRQNALRALTKRDASKYVSADKMRKRGTGTRYTLNDRGVQYLKSRFEKKVAE
jgi:hypothetical protein